MTSLGQGLRGQSPPGREIIPAQMNNGSGPMWSVMIPTFNCAGYLRETLSSVLAQAPGPDRMQIEVIDDASTSDDPAVVTAEPGQGRVGFYRQPANVGHARNFNTCLRRARGQLVHVLHGDDAIRPGFYEILERVLAQHPAAGAAFCRYISMDAANTWLSLARLEQPAAGLVPNWLEKIATGQRLQAPCMVVRREVYETVGGFDHRLAYTEDWEMWVRIAVRFPVCYVPELLALYRVHATSAMAQGQRTGAAGADFRQALHLIAAHLPPDLARTATRQARRSFALACIRRVHRVLERQADRVALIHLREAWRSDRSPEVLLRLGYALARWAVCAAQGAARSAGPRWRPDADPHSLPSG